MSMTLNKPTLDNLAGEIWKSAVRLRGKFKAYKYQSVILPIIVIRRLECVLLKPYWERCLTACRPLADSAAGKRAVMVDEPIATVRSSGVVMYH